MNAPDRVAQVLAWLKVKAELTVPAAFRTFRFPSLAARNVQQKQGDVTVLLESTEVDGPVWKVGVTVIYPGEGPSLESYQQGLLNNRLWLQRAGQNMVEYALLAGFLAVVGAGTLALAGDQIKVILRRLLARTRRNQG